MIPPEYLTLDNYLKIIDMQRKDLTDGERINALIIKKCSGNQGYSIGLDGKGWCLCAES